MIAVGHAHNRPNSYTNANNNNILHDLHTSKWKRITIPVFQQVKLCYMFLYIVLTLHYYRFVRCIKQSNVDQNNIYQDFIAIEMSIKTNFS